MVDQKSKMLERRLQTCGKHGRVQSFGGESKLKSSYSPKEFEMLNTERIFNSDEKTQPSGPAFAIPDFQVKSKQSLVDSFMSN